MTETNDSLEEDDRGGKTQVSCWGSKRKTLNSCSPPPPPPFPLYFPRRESHVICLILVCGWQRGPQLCSSPHSHGSVPLHRLPQHHSAARRGKMVGREERRGMGCNKERLSQWVLVSSRPLHLARWDFVYTRAHTSMQRQMTINGYDNGLCSLSVFPHTIKCFVSKSHCDNVTGSLRSRRAY